MIEYKLIPRHKILSDKEWELYIRAVARETLNVTFHNRVLLVPTEDSDVSSITAPLIIKQITKSIKDILFSFENGTKGIVYIVKPDVIVGDIIKESDVYKSVNVSVLFGDEDDLQVFISKVGKTKTIKILEGETND